MQERNSVSGSEWLKSQMFNQGVVLIWKHGLKKYWYKTTEDKNITVDLFSVFQVSVQFSCSVVSDSLGPHELQLARPPCLSPTPGVHPNPCPLSRWCHPTISSSVVPFSSCPQSFPVSGSFQMSQLFASGGQGIGVSALRSVLPMNTQDWSPLGWTGWISLQSKGLSRVFSNTTLPKDSYLTKTQVFKIIKYKQLCKSNDDNKSY